MSTQKKDKLNTCVERVVHQHIQRITEASIDFTQLFVRRNNIELDRPTMAKVLDIMSQGLASEHISKLDMFMKDLDAALNEFVDED
jgi:hypothetical protein